jgi:hypothetical protein
MKKVKIYFIRTVLVLLFILIFLGLLGYSELMYTNHKILGCIALIAGSVVFSTGMDDYMNKLNKYLKYKNYKVKIGDIVLAYNNNSPTYVVGKLAAIAYNLYTDETTYFINDEEFNNAININQIDNFDFLLHK